MTVNFKRLIFASLLLSPYSASAEFSAILEHEWAVDMSAHGEKFETLFEPGWNTSISDDISMTFIARVRLDGLDNLGPTAQKPVNYGALNGPLVSGSNGEFSIREWYLDAEFKGTYWRVGKQQVVWGQADGLKVLDVVNPQSFREFILDDFDDSRIPLWILNIEIPFGDNNLQILWVPDLSYHEFAETGSTYQINSPIFVPQLPVGVSLIGLNESKPSSVFRDSDFGLKYSMFYEGWDLSFNYLYHYHDTAVLYQQLSQQGVTIKSVYERNHLVGVTASNAFGDFTLRTEVGYSSDTFHLSKNSANDGIKESSEIAYVIGLDWQGIEDVFISFQWFQSHLLEYDKDVIRPQNNNVVSLLYQHDFENEVWQLEVLALHGLDRQDGAIQTKLKYAIESNVKLWLGNDVFYGDEKGLFGQFNNTDRVTFGIEWGL